MEIPLTQGKVAQIDDEDWPLIAPHKWYAARNQRGIWYALTSTPGRDGKQKKLRMHNLILGRKDVDHKDGDGLRNTRGNLRPCTNKQNQQNTGARGGSSRFKGVSWVRSKRRWKAAFNHDGETHFVGYFTDEIEAARDYNEAILPLAGEFARLNDISDPAGRL